MQTIWSYHHDVSLGWENRRGGRRHKRAKMVCPVTRRSNECISNDTEVSVHVSQAPQHWLLYGSPGVKFQVRVVACSCRSFHVRWSAVQDQVCLKGTNLLPWHVFFRWYEWHVEDSQWDDIPKAQKHMISSFLKFWMCDNVVLEEVEV